VQLNAGIGADRIGRVLDIWRVPELRGVRREDGTLSIGALTTYTELMASANVRTALPALAAVSGEVGAAAIQNRGTIGGNVCNASPAGDTLPILLASNAVFHLGGPRGERAVAAEAFFVGYRHTALAADELLLRIEVPVSADRGQVVYRKVGTRRAQSISRTILAVRAFAEGRKLAQVRVAAGCVAEVPLRCRKAEAAIEGRTASPENIAAACAALQEDIRPIDDVRSGAEYRRRASAAVLARLLEGFGR
jgi:xanthine dehydrogenase small subunit